MQKLAKDVYVESGFAGVTVGAIVTPGGLVCIDAPTHPADARRWRLKLAQLSAQPIQYLLNLDAHRDRVLGNQWLEAPTLAHEAASERLRQWPELFKGGPSEAGADADLAAELAGVKVITPRLTFTDRMRLILDGRELALTHRAGHAPGGMWVELPKERLVFTGDAVTLGAPPFLGEADLDLWLAELAELRKARYPVTTIVPGRGAPTDKAGLKPLEDFLKLVRRKLDALLRSKKGRGETAALAETLAAGFSPSAALREHYVRRLRVGLEQLYDRRSGAHG
ncbi:MAG: MBL fold metallo-hydrolase [Anaerolineales bacterium]|nr:MBL fold metallo-hydrolase [Anaerolineales bacterium]